VGAYAGSPLGVSSGEVQQSSLPYQMIALGVVRGVGGTTSSGTLMDTIHFGYTHLLRVERLVRWIRLLHLGVNLSQAAEGVPYHHATARVTVSRKQRLMEAASALWVTNIDVCKITLTNMWS